MNLRQEAMACEDREKGKALARNIDQAQLNKAYYDYFFEGFVKEHHHHDFTDLSYSGLHQQRLFPENLNQHRRPGRYL